MGQNFIGAGGWAYFKIPRLSPLKAYSKAFDYVEINSTFYEIPTSMQVERWRRSVPESFHFSVRAHSSITHGKPFEDSDSIRKNFAKMVEICRILRADVLHFQIPTLTSPERGIAQAMSKLFGLIDTGELLFALELRGEPSLKKYPALLETMKERGILHSIDLLRGEVPQYTNDVLYTRLFGKGQHNLYQPTDDELKQLDGLASGFNRAFMTFHGARMYSDAARMKTYIETGNFPKLTKSTGLESLREILSQDARFPTTKTALLSDQGWKLYDHSDDQRIRVMETLESLPEGTYGSLDDVILAIKEWGDVHG